MTCFWSRISAQPRRSRTSGGLRCSRRSRVSRRQKVTSGCCRRQRAAARTPCSRACRDDLLGEDPLGDEQRGAVQVHHVGAARAVAADVVDRRHGAARGAPARRWPGRPRRRATTGGRPSRPARRSRRGRSAGSAASSPLAVEVVEPEDRQPGRRRQPGLPRPGGSGQDDDTSLRRTGGAPRHCAGRRRRGDRHPDRSDLLGSFACAPPGSVRILSGRRSDATPHPSATLEKTCTGRHPDRAPHGPERLSWQPSRQRSSSALAVLASNQSAAAELPAGPDTGRAAEVAKAKVRKVDGRPADVRRPRRLPELAEPARHRLHPTLGHRDRVVTRCSRRAARSTTPASTRSSTTAHANHTEVTLVVGVDAAVGGGVVDPHRPDGPAEAGRSSQTLPGAP